MKAQILKHTGLTEPEFYAKYGTADAFFNSKSGKAFKAKYGATLKKAQNGSIYTKDTDKNGVPDYLQQSFNRNNYMGAGSIPQSFGSNIGNNPIFGPINDPNYKSISPSLFRPNIPEDISESVIKDLGKGGYQKTATDIMNEGLEITEGAANTAKSASNVDNTGAYIQAAIQAGTAIAEGIPNVKAQKKKVKQSRAMADASDVVKKAFFSTDVDARNVYADNAKRVRNALMPVVSGDEFFPSYGVGTNALGQAKSGSKLKKANYGEIMNTFAPGTIYDDLGYESTYQPLTDEETVKAYRSGGLMKAQYGVNYANEVGGYLNSDHFKKNASSYQTLLNSGTAIMNNIGDGPDAGTGIGGGIGSAIGTAAGMYFGGPAVSAVLGAAGKFVGGAIGGVIDQSDTKIKKANKRFRANLDEMTNIGNLRNTYSAYTKNGGNINPQELKYFGEHSVKSLFKPDPEMQTLRTGGNMRQNSVGDVHALSGGSLEPLAFNTKTGSAITKIDGQSHEESNGKHTGVLLGYQSKQDGGPIDPKVEAEGGEIVTEIPDIETGIPQASIYGNQRMNKSTVGDDSLFANLHGKTFKKVAENIALQTNKLNKQKEKSTAGLNRALQDHTPFGKLEANSYMANSMGIETRLAINDVAMKKAAAYQDINNKVVNEYYGLNSGDFSRGKLSTEELSKVSKNGGLIKAQYGNDVPYKNKPISAVALPSGNIGDYSNIPEWSSEEAYKSKWVPSVMEAYGDDNRVSKIMNYINNYQGEGADRLKALLNEIPTPEGKKYFLLEQATNEQIGPIHNIVRAALRDTAPAAAASTPAATTSKKDKNYGVVPYEENGWETLAGQILPWIRRQPGEPLQGDQILGEMLTLATNKEEPVQARYYHPNLRTPYDISYQDQLNANQADFNQLARATADNPEALAALAAQKYGANSKVLAEQFRANQAMKEGIYSQNTGILNDALMKNLQIADQQYVRQATAKSATKATQQAALNSIENKIAQNRLENRTLQTYANLFPDYSYDNQFRIRKTGAPVKWDINQGVYQPGEGEITEVPVYKDGKIVRYRAIGEEEKTKTATARNGSIVKAFRDL